MNRVVIEALEFEDGVEVPLAQVRMVARDSLVYERACFPSYADRDWMPCGHIKCWNHMAMTGGIWKFEASLN